MTRALKRDLPLEGLHVVIVDDNANMRRLVCRLLQSFGATDLREASDGESALDMVRTLPPDLVVCDWNMKPMDGIEFLQNLRHLDSGEAAIVPAIMLTAHSRSDLVEAARKAGANHFLVKPVVPEMLLKRILWVLRDKPVVMSKKKRSAHQAVWID